VTWGTSAGAHEIGALKSVSGYGYSRVSTTTRLAGRNLDNRQLIRRISMTMRTTPSESLTRITYPTPAPTGGTGTRFKIQYGYSYGFPSQITNVTQGNPSHALESFGRERLFSPTNESVGVGAVSVVLDL